MKYVVVLADGMADYPIKELGNKTPLEYAKTPNLDMLVKSSEVGTVKTVPDGMPPGSDVANLSVLGYDPRKYYTGRSPLEALSMGVDLGENDVAFRCNLVTLSEDSDYEQKIMLDYSADEISTEEASLLIEEVSRHLRQEGISFFPGLSYRHLMVWRGGPLDTVLTPPHDIPNQIVGPYLPQGKGSQLLRELMFSSYVILSQHPLNKKRAEKGLKPANSLWFWGQGKKPAIPSFPERFGIKGSVISAVDLTRGLGIAAGLSKVLVPGATGNIHTNFLGKALATLEELKKGQDFVYLHIEAPDEAGHRGELETKIKAIEEIDEKVIGVLISGLNQQEDFKLMVLPDHPTPLAVRTHVADPVPYLIYHKKKPIASGLTQFSEKQAMMTNKHWEEGHLLMSHFLSHCSS